LPVNLFENEVRDLQDYVLKAELEQVYRQHRQSLFSLALTLTGCAGLAEDAVHEAFAHLCRRSEKPAGSLTAYVFASVRNAAIDIRRRQEKQLDLVQSVFADPSASSISEQSGYRSSDWSEGLKIAIDQLDECTRHIVVMKIFSELTFDEIGEVLEMPSPTVATRYRRALLKLEELLRTNS
jgi:RNA polymerase sigma-70 factor (ECF subfamily)